MNTRNKEHTPSAKKSKEGEPIKTSTPRGKTPSKSAKSGPSARKRPDGEAPEPKKGESPRAAAKKAPALPKKSPAELLNERSRGTLIEQLGIRFLEVNADEVVAEMVVDERHLQPMGLLHGGASIALAETVAGAGSTFLLTPEESALGLQVSANHLQTATKGERLFGIGKLIHRGRTTHLWNIGIMKESNEMVSTVRIVNQIIKKRR